MGRIGVEHPQRRPDDRVAVGVVPARHLGLRPGEPRPENGGEQQVEQPVEQGLLPGRVNDALDTVKVPSTVEGAARVWSDYSSRWTLWNHVRTVSSSVSLLLVGAGLFIWGTRA